MTSSEKLAAGLLSQGTIMTPAKVEEQVQHIRGFIEREQRTLLRMKRVWFGVFLLTQVLLWVSVVFLPPNQATNPELTAGALLALAARSLFPALIVGSCVALLLIHYWRKSRAEAHSRLLEIETRLTEFSAQHNQGP